MTRILRLGFSMATHTHRQMRVRALILVLACSLAACSDATGPADAGLIGNWTSPAYSTGANSSYKSLLSLRPDQSYTLEARNYVSASAQAKDEASSYTRFEGTYVVRNDSLFTHPVRIVSWDSFNGPSSPVVVTVDPVIAKAYADGMRFDVSQETLTLYFLSYPADAPVETSASYLRVH
ncbi:MAG: hypothetical protein ABJE10_14375 [bacterium]